MTRPAYRGVAGLQVRLAEDGILRLLLDRPEKRNALNDEMVAALIEAIDTAGRDEAVRAILVSGTGDHFCAGFDIVGRNAEAGDGRPRAGSIQRRLPSQAHRLIPLVATVQTPVVCAVRGWVAGIGLHLALAADFTVAADDARLWEPFAERGFTPDSGGTWLLPRRVGEVRARELLLLGRRLDGAEALAWGMVARVVPAAEVEAEGDKLAAQLASGPTVSLGLTKWLLHAAASAPLESHLRDEAFGLELSTRSEDFREGLAALKDRREPRFKGR
jgi:2-(1,2-epoxy-1,2-dihydrophenyl)acetyl-CoA isomerase